MKKLLLLTAIILGLSSCAAVELPTGDELFNVNGMTFPEEESVSVSANGNSANGNSAGGSRASSSESLVPYTVLYEAPGFERAKYEPPFGCYTAALLTSGASLRAFNGDTKHAVYARDVVLGEEFPSTWMLSCIAAQTVPLVLLHPNPDGELSIPQINAAAVWLGGYNLPMFVAFCPVTEETETPPDNYRVYFRHARSLLRIHAPQTAMMWLADSGAENANDYYPGDDVVDWVGFSTLEENLLGSFEDFYMEYQEKKPLMLGPLGVSHFSDEDYTYHTEAAADKISEIYSAVRNEYPRVKMIAYADINQLPEGGSHDYSVSQIGELSAAYAAATADAYYLTALSKAGGSERSEWLRSKDIGYVKDGKPVIIGRNASDLGDIQPDHAKRVLYVYAKKFP